MKKKIHIFAPLSKHGGREIETGFIASLFQYKYNVSLISLVNYYKNSDVEIFNKIPLYSSLNKEVYHSNILIRILIFLMSIIKKKNTPLHFRLSNKLIKKIFDIEKSKIEIIESNVKKSDLIIICAQLSSNYVKEIVQIAKDNNVPTIFRTTGTIKVNDKNKDVYNWCKNVSLFLHHSESNAEKLNKYINVNYKIIDQCALYEDKLLKIIKQNEKVSTFLVLSRLSPEKQIDKVINGFNSICSKTDKLLIYGDGEEKNKLLKLASESNNIEFRGVIENKNIDSVFEESDCLIISSSEEAGPISGIESMAAGVLIISTKVGAMPERLKDYKFWYDGTQKDLERVMKQVKTINGDQLQNYSKNLRNIYKKHYSLGYLKNQYENTVGKIIREFN